MSFRISRAARLTRAAAALFALPLLVAPSAAFAQVAPASPTVPASRLAIPLRTAEDSLLARMRSEAFQHSSVVETATMLSDVLGPRLAGSPEFRSAAEWARQRMTTFGLVNAALEPWGKRGGWSWTVTRQSVEVIGPRYERIVAFPRAWSPPTVGVVRGVPVHLDIRGDSDLARFHGKLKGAIVLNGPTRTDTSRFMELGERLTGTVLDSLSRLTEPGEPRDYWDDSGDYAANVRRRLRIMQLFRQEGVAVLLEPARNSSAVDVGGYQAYDTDVSGAVPVFRVERGDFDRLVHKVEMGSAPTMEVRLDVRAVAPVTAADSTGYNIVGEIRGSDPTLSSEVVMIGGHFDSWNPAGGATDNAAGCAVAMEALRILVATGQRPRRTIRVALWDGEEHEDYFGSMGYVKKHFGDPETMALLPDHARLSAYFNVDNGTGRIRGIYLQNDAAARPVLASILAPLADLGATTLTIKNTGSTDHMPFVSVGLPGFTFIQDPIDYETRTHHTQLDDAAYLMPEDLKQASLVSAWVLLHVANLPDKLPRPALPPARAH